MINLLVDDVIPNILQHLTVKEYIRTISITKELWNRLLPELLNPNSTVFQTLQKCFVLEQHIDYLRGTIKSYSMPFGLISFDFKDPTLIQFIITMKSIIKKPKINQNLTLNGIMGVLSFSCHTQCEWTFKIHTSYLSCSYSNLEEIKNHKTLAYLEKLYHIFLNHLYQMSKN